jgi:Family of unknown function (DUF5681)
MSQEQSKNRKPWHFQPGQSGNPGGRPKGTSLTSELRNWAQENNKSVIDAVAFLVVEKRDIRAIEFLFDRVDGPLKHNLDLTSTESVLDMLRTAYTQHESNGENGSGLPGRSNGLGPE